MQHTPWKGEDENWKRGGMNLRSVKLTKSGKIRDMIDIIKVEITNSLRQAGVTTFIELTTPPKSEMGDFAFACFDIAKEWGVNPADAALKIKSEILKRDVVHSGQAEIINKVENFGPYVNFFVDGPWLAQLVFAGINEEYGKLNIGEKKQVLVEYGCPNPLKAFHLGHLRNLISGESVARILDNVGYEVVRVNYQGDIGMHVAKALWGVVQLKEESEAVKNKSLVERVAFLGKAYVSGARHFEKDETSQSEIIEYNDRVYRRDPALWEMYQTTRQWSLDYFAMIYEKLGVKFDRLYFESEVFEPGTKLVKEFLQPGVFRESEGAIIFAGSEYGLHDRVFINSQGFPTYEAKDVGLAEKHFREYRPELVVHVVGKEQIEYFKVVFKALELVIPESKGKDFHLPGVYLQLKGDKKMSSRTGNVVTGDALMEHVEARITEIMKDRDLPEKEKVIKRVTVAALKYTMLKSGVSADISFDLEESVNLSGDSGPYLLYIVARIKSILKKSEIKTLNSKIKIQNLEIPEKILLLDVAQFPEVVKDAAETYDSSQIARFLFKLAQDFNSFYHTCPVLEAEADVRLCRLELIQSVELVMTRGLYLLGIEVVEEM